MQRAGTEKIQLKSTLQKVIITRSDRWLNKDFSTLQTDIAFSRIGFRQSPTT